MLNLQKGKVNILRNSSGFIAADFLFSFVLIIGCGIIIFALTFSLATIEIGQYITWSASRAYMSAAKDKDESEKAGRIKFQNLSKRFPLLTGSDGDGAWFELTLIQVGDNASAGMKDVQLTNRNAGAAENRHPWTGVATELNLKLFQSLQIPFLGKLATDPSVFTMPLRSFLMRNPSQKECLQFYSNRYSEGILKLESGNWSQLPTVSPTTYQPMEDNGC